MPRGSYTEGQTKTVPAVRMAASSGWGSISSIQITPSRSSCSRATPFCTSSRISGVSGAPAHRISCTSGSRRRAASKRYGRPFCRVMRPTKTTLRRAGSMPKRSSTSGFSVARPPLEVDPVVHDVHARGVDGRVAAQDVGAHPGTDRDHRVGGLERGLLDPAGHAVAAAELLRLPGTQRLEGMGGHDVRDAAGSSFEVTCRVRVPGVGVHDVGTLHVLRHLEVDPEGREGRVRGGQLRGDQIGVGVRFVTGQPEAAHDHVDVAPERRDQLGDMHPGTPVDLGRILTAQNIDSHACRR